MDSTPAPLACPVCFEAFAPTAGAAFALHVSSCSTTVSPPGSPYSAAHCPRCFHVYAAGTLAHEISFHEHECARVNDLPERDDDASDEAAGRKPKRPRNGGAAHAVAAPRVTLFPSACFLCGNGGRGLLHCGGSCARAAHQNCVDQLQAPASGEPLSVAERKQAAGAWKCAQCTRGLYRCQKCGFLGHESNGMRKCAVLDCGFHFHEQCLPNAEQDETVHAGFVCPRHTCATCGTQETDMRRCKSCSVCFHMTHLRCPRGSGAAASGSTNSGGLDPTNLFVCPKHDGETKTSLASSFDASNSLRQRLAAGDVVLVLEFNNALLPPSAKKAAPDAANHWGVVTSAEETEPHGCGNQLLSVRMFADENVLVVPNQYALRVAAASDFSRPVELIRHCLQRHAMAELQVRQTHGNVDDAEAKRILTFSNAAFAARLRALGVAAAEAKSNAEEGLARWRRFQATPEPRHYDGLGEAAPSYLYIDTRGSQSTPQAADSTDTSEAVGAEADGDVPMTDPDSDSGGATTNGTIRFGSPHARSPSRPKSAGKSPHEAKAERQNSTLSDTQSTQDTVMATQDTVVATQDTVVAMQDSAMGTQDTQPDNDSQALSEATSTSTIDLTTPAAPRSNADSSTNDADVADVNSNKRPADVTDGADAKRQKIITETSEVSPAVFTPQNFRPLQFGTTPSSTSVPSTLHISPMSSGARSILPQKRKHLTRKQKILADMPDVLLQELEHETFRYLEDADGAKSKPLPVPSDDDPFPSAAQATRFRPAFFRPTVMLGHSGLRRPGVDAVSRLLVSQDKRSIKCFVQSTGAEEDATKCSHLNVKSSPATPGFVLLDLMTLRSFRDLEAVVRTRLVESLGKRSRYTREYFGMDAHHAQRWLEQQRRKKISDQSAISLSYCAIDGVRHHLDLKQVSKTKPSPKDRQTWLCFCANVCHLSVSIAVSRTNHSASRHLPVPEPVAGVTK
ncbi:PHD finger-containing protein [Phytophthora citrophthora]|uniref:PHD finger-containing protein n=1 Tax=Phytophthora citrophthora TaxID=4793 RepID=A0AAD9LFP2_9STRA|nr:PHD finger-containing protein [Phytophthora citrophthora]